MSCPDDSNTIKAGQEPLKNVANKFLVSPDSETNHYLDLKSIVKIGNCIFEISLKKTVHGQLGLSSTEFQLGNLVRFVLPEFMLYFSKCGLGKGSTLFSAFKRNNHEKNEHFMILHDRKIYIEV